MASTNRDEISRLELLHAAHPDGLVFPHLADAYRRAGRYAQAESVLNAGLRRHSDYSSAHVVLGRLRMDQGKRREAENAFQRVLQLDSQNHVALEFLGRLAAEEGKAEAALGYFRRLASLKPSDELVREMEDLERQVRNARRAIPESADPERRLEAAAPTPSDAGRGRAGDLDVDQGSRTRRSRGAGGVVGGNGGGDLHGEGAATGEPNPAGAPRGGPRGGPHPADGHQVAAQADWDDEGAAPLPEPGEVVTETMAELYTRQGLHERAQAVYRNLFEQDPGNPRLRDRLAEVTERLKAAAAGPSAAPTAAPDSPGADPGVAHDVPRDATGPGIRGYMAGLLAWQPEAADSPAENGPAAPEKTDPGLEPWADSPVSRAAAPEGPSESAAEAAAPVESASEAPSRQAPVRDTSVPETVAPEAAAPEAAPADRAARAGGGSEPPRPDAFPWDRRVDRPGATAEGLGLTEDPLEGASPQTRALIALTDMLVGLLEYRDPFFRGSSSLTRLLAGAVAREMGLSETDRVNLALAAVLRDLGRLALGGRLVESQEMSRTPEARRRIERHVDLALHLMEGIELPREVTLAVRHHHERWDGAGYPDGLSGAAIPRLARLLAVVDSFAAMVSPRPYRLPRKVPDAAREVRESAGSHFDPEVVDALLRVLDRRDQPRMGFVQRHHILLLNPDQPGAVVTAAKLCTSGFLAEVTVDADTARERLRRVPVAALVVSAETGAEQTADLIHDLRLDPLFASLPIVVVEAETVALRVRLLESGADVCFPPGISHGELQGTLGALVRRTLRTRQTAEGGEDAPWLALQGDIQDFPLAWLLQVMKYDSRTAAVGIRTATDQGAIYIQKGDVVHAQIRGGQKGESALKQMLEWGKGRFTVQPDATPKERSIETSIMHLLLTQAVEQDHAAAGVFGAVSDGG